MNNNNPFDWLSTQDLTDLYQVYAAKGLHLFPDGSVNHNYYRDPAFLALARQRAQAKGMPIHGANAWTSPMMPTPVVPPGPSPAPTPVIETPPRVQEIGAVIHYTENDNGNKQFELDPRVHIGVDTSKVMIDATDNKPFLTSNDGKRRHYLVVKAVKKEDDNKPDDDKKPKADDDDDDDDDDDKADVKPSPQKKAKNDTKKKKKKKLPQCSIFDLMTEAGGALSSYRSKEMDNTVSKPFKVYVRNLTKTLELVGATLDDNRNVIKKGTNEARGTPCLYLYLGHRKFREKGVYFTPIDLVDHLTDIVMNSRLREHALYFAVFSLVTEVKVGVDKRGTKGAVPSSHSYLSEIDLKHVLQRLFEAVSGKRRTMLKEAITAVEKDVKERWEPNV